MVLICMPLEGFNIIDWASQQFGSLPPLVMGGLGLALLVVGIVVGVAGARMVPVSWGLMVSGCSMAVLTYFIVGAAVAGASSEVAGTEQVASAAPRVVPWAAAMAIGGLGTFSLRMALRSWSHPDRDGKIVGVLLALVGLAALYVGIQIVRGAGVVHSPPRVTETERVQHRRDRDDDVPVRRRGITAPRR